MTHTALISQIGLPGLILILVLVVLLFGRGKISQLMGDVAKGIGAFKKGMKESDQEEAAAQRAINEGGPTVEARPTSAAAETSPSEPRGNS